MCHPVQGLRWGAEQTPLSSLLSPRSAGSGGWGGTALRGPNLALCPPGAHFLLQAQALKSGTPDWSLLSGQVTPPGWAPFLHRHNGYEPVAKARPAPGLNADRWDPVRHTIPSSGPAGYLRTVGTSPEPTFTQEARGSSRGVSGPAFRQRQFREHPLPPHRETSALRDPSSSPGP